MVSYHQLNKYPHIQAEEPDKCLLIFFKATVDSGKYATDIGYRTIAMLKYILEDTGKGKDRKDEYPKEYELASSIYEEIMGGTNNGGKF